MKPIDFNGANCAYAKNQKEYLPLPAYKHNDDWQCVTSCWSLSLFERIRVLFTGKVYSTLATFGKPLMPQKLSSVNPINGLEGE